MFRNMFLAIEQIGHEKKLKTYLKKMGPRAKQAEEEQREYQQRLQEYSTVCRLQSGFLGIRY